MKIESPIVSVEWLKAHLEAPNLVILNATIPKVTSDQNNPSKNLLIPHSRIFDIKSKFSDTSAPFPSTFPSVLQFTCQARRLGINKTSRIVVYDDKGIYSSPRAWWLFKAFGHDQVAVLDGGLLEWSKAKFPLKPLENLKVKEGDFKAIENKRLMKFFSDVKTESQKKNHTIIDARSEKRFKGLVSEPRVGLRRGTIPNSVNLPFENLLNGHRLKSKDQLLQIISPLANTSTPLTFSCGSGITACVLALGAEIAGYKDISVYDGSWTEWGTLEND